MFKVLLIISLFFLYSCSNSDNSKIEKNNPDTTDLLYKKAMVNLQNEKYSEAKFIFESINSRAPLSNEAIKSQLMIGFIHYINLDYQSAILSFDRLINKYPAYNDIDYAYYMKAMCYYEQIENDELDGQMNNEALRSFKKIVNRFPNSEYSKDSLQKIIAIKENIASKHMNIGFFYLNQQKYFAALNRFKRVVEDHSKSKFVPEALYRLLEIYYKLGMIEDAEKIASVIGYNYPKSKWYEYSYKLVGEKEEEEKHSSIFNKLSNLIKGNDKEK